MSKFSSKKTKNPFKRFSHMPFQRVVLVGVMIGLQVLMLLLMILRFSAYFVQFYLACIAISVCVGIWIIGNRSNISYKLPWLLVICLFPVFGGLFYVLIGGNRTTRRERKKLSRIDELFRSAMRQEPDTPVALDACGPDGRPQALYLLEECQCPPYVGTYSEYLPMGEIKFSRMVEELEKAEHFIFLEYFIIGEGRMWETILDILLRKVQQGVEVRVIYDDFGCITTLPKGYDRWLRERGIQCAVFGPFVPVMSVRLNNRDHRKICVIDGYVGITGGINLADEYINKKERFGHWKDTAILLKGNAVWSLTVMFLATWNYITQGETDYEQFRPSVHNRQLFTTDGVVQPYCDSPLDHVQVGYNVYLNMINRAKKYIYLVTPYLVIDSAMTNALCVAAKSGVDVRIMTPGIPDKRTVYEMTQAHYPPLLEAGVKIYQYTPGFVHAKTFAVDDRFGTVGTINMDYRSFYLHFECGVWLCNSSSILQIRDDFLETQKLCQEVTLESTKKLSWLRRLFRTIMKVFAPLM